MALAGPLIKRAVAVLLAGAMLFVADRGVAARALEPSDVHALLDVPYVSQTPALCGGAAVAMVLRYWGEHRVFPQDFAPLVGPGDGGILTAALASAVRDRGWQALLVPVNEDSPRTRIRSEIDRGRPLIALIEVGPSTYHYVVIVGNTDREVVMHDPARAPFRVLPWAEFDRAWTATGRWLMLVLPPGGLGPADPGDDRVRVTPPAWNDADPADLTPCSALVDRGVHMALTGDREGAERGLVAATSLCPNDPASWRELAGLRFSQSRWSEAQDLALSAVRLAPDDAYAWQIVATSRYLVGDTMGALEAWNRTGEPRIDTIDIGGAERTRQPVVIRATGLQPRQLLTPEAFARALRRLREVPVASSARMQYEPVFAKEGGGLANVGVFIAERGVVPSGWPALATHGARAILRHEMRVDLAGPLGAGEVMTAAWRWSTGRPRVAVSLAFPSPLRLPGGILLIDGSWEQQSYGATSSPDAAPLREERRHVGLRFADWSTSRLRWETSAALDRLRQYDDTGGNRFTARDYLAVESALDARLAGDRLALAASGGWWAPFTGGDRFATGGLLAAWRSTDNTTLAYWSAVTEIGVTSRVSPLALWQGAGTGQGRSALLRAHPLLKQGGVLAGPVFGRDVAHASLEYVRPVGHTRLGGVSIAGFVDTARAWHRLNGLDSSPAYIDAGAGVRVPAPDVGGAIRIDVAHGLRGGDTTLSAGWGGRWPR